LRAVVLMGGRSSEHEVSVASGRSVAAGLRVSGHAVVEVVIDHEGVWRLGDGSEVAVRPGRGLLDADVAYPVLHGPFGEDGTVQGLLECLDVAYTGSDVAASALCMDKVRFKDAMAHAGLPQVAYVGVTEARRSLEAAAIDALGYPCWVKPARLGSSVGIVRVDAPEALEAALDAAFGHDPRVIVEATGPGREVECSVLGPTDAPEASLPGEILLGGGEDAWYDFEAKYTPGGMELVVPARISAAATERVRVLARRAFTLAGCSGFARVDFFVDGDTVVLNELNTIPGFTETSVFGKLFDASGVPYAELLERLATYALDRREGERAYRY
jgi:D-alanine-D-alanine ligase